jgi:hypothetical protein
VDGVGCRETPPIQQQFDDDGVDFELVHCGECGREIGADNGVVAPRHKQRTHAAREVRVVFKEENFAAHVPLRSFELGVAARDERLRKAD